MRRQEGAVRDGPDNLLTGIAFLAFVGFGLNAGLGGVAWPSIRDTFGVGDDAFGTIAVVSLVGSLVVTALSGRLLDRFGVGVVLLVSFASGSLGTLGYASAPAWWMVVALMSVTAMGTSPINAGINTYFATYESAGRMNWLHACFGLGATLGPGVMTLVLKAGLSWRWGYYVVVVIEALLALCFAVTLRRWPGPQGNEQAAGRPTLNRTKRTWAMPAVWLSVFLFFVFTGMEGASGQWPYTLFTEGGGVEPAVAGAWVSAYWASMTVGRLFFGIVVDRIDATLLVRICLGGVVLGAVAMWASPATSLGFAGLALTGFFLAPLFPVLTSNTPERLGSAHASDAIGYQITAVKLGLALIPALGGVLAENVGVNSIGPFLLAISVVAFLLHEATLWQSR